MVNVLLAAGTIVAVIFLLGICIFVHELGHLIVALWRNLHVEKFSIGFGHKLWGTTINGVEYVISSLPIGGYVALPQLDPSDKPAETSEGVPLPPAKPLDRILTAFAGPFSNILLGFMLATLLWQIGMWKPAPAEHYVVQSVEEGSAEDKAGLRPLDKIVMVNGNKVPPNWHETIERIILSPGDITLGVDRDGQFTEITYPKERHPDPGWDGLPYPRFEVRENVAVKMLVPGFPAQVAGLKVGDRLLRVDGKPVANAKSFTDMIAASNGSPVTVDYKRGDARAASLTITPRQITEKTEEGLVDRYVIGLSQGVPLELVKVSPWQQFVDVLGQNKRTIRAMATPGKSKIDPSKLSGPVGILSILYKAVRFGLWRQLISLLILINFGLAFLNLLPIPVLDGGHIMMAVIEWVVRRRIPHRLAYVLQMSCFVLLMGFIIYVSGFDVGRLFKKGPGESTSEPTEVQEPE